MKDNKENPTADKANDPTKGKKRKTARRIAKWVGGIVVSIALLLVVFATLVVWILTPEKLTPLIEKYGSEYLIADVKLDRAELTFWHSFPHLQVDVDNLQIISRALDKGLTEEQRAALPVYADSLLSVKRFHGGINILKLMTGKIAIYDIDINHPVVNLVTVSDKLANYNIVPPSEKKDSSELSIPDISLNRFVISGGAPIRYYSVPDSLDVAVNLKVIDLDGNQNPRYSLEIDGNTSAQLAPYVDLTKLPLQVNGFMRWSPKEPMKAGLEDFLIGAGPLKAVFTTDIDATDELTVESFKGRLEQFTLTDLVPFLPEEYRAELSKIKSNLSLKADAELLHPYTPSKNPTPYANVTLEVPDGSLSYDGYTVSTLGMLLTANVDGSNIDRSVLTVKKLKALGEGVGFELTGTATDVLKDPLVDGHFNGNVNFSRLPKKLLSMIPAIVSGDLRGEFDFRLRRSYLKPDEFHRILLNGAVTLTKLDVIQNELGARLYSHIMDLKLGTSNSFVKNDMKSDSLLTFSLKTDSLYVELPGMTLSARDMLLGAGTKNIASSIDRSKINPIGAVFKVDRLNFESQADSMSVRLRELMCNASLQRYENNARVPLLTFNLDAKRMRYSDQYTRINFRETNLTARCHTRLKPRMSKRMEECFDSIQARYPNLRPDSIYALAQKQMRDKWSKMPRKPRKNDGTENIDYGLDNSTKKWLKWLDFKGTLTASRARLFTPFFPVKNRLTDINVAITPDSLTIRNTGYRMGQSDFLINGTISNITNALTSRRQTMKIRFRLSSDTINVNEIAEAAFAGAAFAEKLAQGQQVNLGDTDNDELMQTMIQQTAATDQTAAIVIPMNIDASLSIKAKNIIYSDIAFHDFRGNALIYEGALNLHKLTASTDMGSVNMTALYSAPTRRDIDFAFGMDIKDFQIEKFMKLVPAVDTLMPLLNDIKGIINAEVAAKSKVDSLMNLEIPSLSAAIKITGDSLVLLDAETFKKISKWLLFKDKKHNMVDHMEVQLVVDDSQLELFPFVFEIDRYRLGVMGGNDLAMNYNYHVSVLKSPIPFKFGINIKGNHDKMKIRLGRAKFKENMMVEKMAIVDTTRINLINQIENVFRRGVNNARLSKMNLPRPDNSFQHDSEAGDTISGADSLLFIKEGLLPAPPVPVSSQPAVEPSSGKKKKKK